MPEKSYITVQVIINAPLADVWNFWTDADAIMHWNHASEDWHTPRASIDLKIGGTFSYRMESKDGTQGFDFSGVFTEILPHERLSFTLDDGRTVIILCESRGKGTLFTETFQMENLNSREMQEQGWQAILDNFKAYAETHRWM